LNSLLLPVFTNISSPSNQDFRVAQWTWSDNSKRNFSEQFSTEFIKSYSKFINLCNRSRILINFYNSISTLLNRTSYVLKKNILLFGSNLKFPFVFLYTVLYQRSVGWNPATYFCVSIKCQWKGLKRKTKFSCVFPTPFLLKESNVFKLFILKLIKLFKIYSFKYVSIEFSNFTYIVEIYWELFVWK